MVSKSLIDVKEFENITQEKFALFLKQTNKQTISYLSSHACNMRNLSLATLLRRGGSMFISEEIPQLKPFVWP